jgi:hypothetical protein
MYLFNFSLLGYFILLFCLSFFVMKKLNLEGYDLYRGKKFEEYI